jgi:hypothetical protein
MNAWDKENQVLLREMQEILRLAAEPRRECDNAKSRIARAATVLQLPWRRAYSLWYGEEDRRVRDEEAARLRAERDRLLRLRLERLEREAIELRRFIDETERRDATKAGAADGNPLGMAGAAGQAPA